MLFGFLLFIFIIVCIFLCLLILIQSDKGGGISGAIGGGLGGANTLLGTQDTANLLTRGTAIFGGAFLVLCVLMSFVVTTQSNVTQKSLLQKRAEKQQSFSPSSVLEGQGLPMQQGGEGATPGTAPDQGAPAGTLPMAPPADQPAK
jgi:preprotein translocase subunit SecG